METAEFVFHIAEKKLWLECSEKCKLEYTPKGYEAEGFIHLSTKKQLFKVASKFYSGRDDILILKIHAQKLNSKLLWEGPIHPGKVAENSSLNTPKASLVTDTQTTGTSSVETRVKSSDGEELFPHLYAPLNRDAVVGVYSLYWQGDDLMISGDFFK